MKKQIITLMLVLVLVGSLIAIEVSNLKKINIDITKHEKEVLKNRSIVQPNVTKLICTGNTCRFKMYQEREDKSNYGLGSHKIPWTYCSLINESLINNEMYNDSTYRMCLEWDYYSLEQLEIMKKDKIKQWLKDYVVILETNHSGNIQVNDTKGEVIFNGKSKNNKI